MKHNVDRDKLWNLVERKTVPNRSASFLDDPDSSFNFRDVLACAGQIDSRSVGDGLYQGLKRCKLAITMDCCDAKAAIEVEHVDPLKALEDLSLLLI